VGGCGGCIEGMNPDVTFTPEARSLFGRGTVLAEHKLDQSELFSDASLAAIVEQHPEHLLHALTMGFDPMQSSDNEKVQHAGVSGVDVLEAVRRGRLWLNITNIDAVDPRFRELTDQLYSGVRAQNPSFRVDETHATLLISSPGAMVYYHVDGPPSFLWHIRGRKRVWVYPAQDESLLSRAMLEDVFAGVRQEYVPYQSSFDDRAEIFDLEPGQCAMWVQNAPHRVSNLDSFNVSLVTDHYTDEARRRARVYRANRFLRAKAHVPHRFLSAGENGPLAVAKVSVHKACSLLKLDDKIAKAHRAPSRRIDASASNGLSAL
jgi:hypothetical protein